MARYGFTIYRDTVREGAPTGDDASRTARVRPLRGSEPRRGGGYVLYCFGLHDRAFKEGPVLGKLRPLKSSSTRRKFDVQPYLDRVAELD